MLNSRARVGIDVPWHRRRQTAAARSSLASTCPGIEFLPRGDGFRSFAPMNFAITKHGLRLTQRQGAQSCALSCTIDQRLGAIFPTSHCHRVDSRPENIVAAAPSGLKKNFP